MNDGTRRYLGDGPNEMDTEFGLDDAEGVGFAASFASSCTVGAIGAALAKAQGAMRSAAKDATNPHLRTRYADLASVWEAARTALSANGLAVVQAPEREEGGVGLTTMLIDASGEWFRSRLYLPAKTQTAQDFGAAITYARRYALSAMVGVAPGDDDDGESVQDRSPQRAPEPPPPQRPNPEAEARVADYRAQLARCGREGGFDELRSIGASIGKSGLAVALRRSLDGDYRAATAAVEARANAPREPGDEG